MPRSTQLKKRKRKDVQRLITNAMYCEQALVHLATCCPEMEKVVNRLTKSLRQAVVRTLKEAK
jgi:hypothetical protein